MGWGVQHLSIIYLWKRAKLCLRPPRLERVRGGFSELKYKTHSVARTRKDRSLQPVGFNLMDGD